MTVGERIKYRRKELGISADKLAERIGVSRATVFRWENGAIEKVPGDTLVPIAQALSVSPAYLMGLESLSNSRPAIVPESSDVLTDDERQLLTDYRALNDDGQSFVRTTVRSLVSSGAYIKSHLSEQTQIG